MLFTPLCVFFCNVLCVLNRSLTAASHSTWIQGYVGMGVFPRSEVCQPVWTSERSLAQTHGDSQPQRQWKQGSSVCKEEENGRISWGWTTERVRVRACLFCVYD